MNSELCLLGSLWLWSDPGLWQLRWSHFPSYLHWRSAVGCQEDQQCTHCEFEEGFRVVYTWFCFVSLLLSVGSDDALLALLCLFVFLYISGRSAVTQWVGLLLWFRAAWSISRRDRNQTMSNALSLEAATIWSNSGSKFFFDTDRICRKHVDVNAADRSLNKRVNGLCPRHKVFVHVWKKLFKKFCWGSSCIVGNVGVCCWGERVYRLNHVCFCCMDSCLTPFMCSWQEVIVL